MSVPRRPRLAQLLPRSLTGRLTLGLVVIVVIAGAVTTVAVNELVGRSLRAELARSGETLSSAAADGVTESLLSGDRVAAAESLAGLVSSEGDVVYALAYGPDGRVVSTFDGGVPRDLLDLAGTAEMETEHVLDTGAGRVRHFAVAPIAGVPLEVHLGLSEARVTSQQRSAALFLLALTLAGCAAAALVTYAFGNVMVRPLRALTCHVRELAPGHLHRRIDVDAGDEVGELAEALNSMSADLEAAAEQLVASERGYRELLRAGSAVGEGIALIADEGGEEGTFAYVNEQFASLAGYPPAELVGRNAAGVVSARSLDVVRMSWSRLRQGSEAVEPTEISLVDRRGGTRILETASTVIEYQGQRVLAWFTRDVTERRQREREVRRQNRELAALHAVASVLGDPLPPDALLDRALEQVLPALGLHAGWAVVFEQDQARLSAARGVSPDPTAATEFPSCPCGEAVKDGQSLLVDAGNSRCVARSVLRGCEGLAAHASVPLQAGGAVLGSLSVATQDGRVFDQAEFRLLAAIGQQMAVGLQNARLWASLREKGELRSELLARVIRAQEDERQRIARELHDTTGQSLNALVLGLNAASLALEASPEQVEGIIQRLASSASDTVRELQAIIYDLRPSLLDDLGLVPALRWFVEDRLGALGVALEMDVDGEPDRLPSEAETAMFRMAQEAVSNIARHAAAQRIRIDAEFGTERATLRISDDGVGFTPGAVAGAEARGQGLGLLGMRERASLLGGHVTIDSAPGAGTRVELTMPTVELAQ